MYYTSRGATNPDNLDSTTMTRPTDTVIYLENSVHAQIRDAAKLENRTIKGYCQEHMLNAVRHTRKQRGG